MESPVHNLNALFAQLGLPNSDQNIADFIERHKPVSGKTKLAELDFFTPSQQAFLRESLAQDADWAEVIDTLDSLLRHEPDIRPG
ncbi:MAG: DUF2789 domain-containing protein [Saccharospirillaceae bacterium]|nr:DUF2789 domain-containing protein [Saccharospirillaceae bacterium]MCD8532606.1 DUF2789 domain-containing protein [Saccharospirillaceae bacterium]